MVVSFRYVFGWMVSAFRCRGNLVLETEEPTPTKKKSLLYVLRNVLANHSGTAKPGDLAFPARTEI
jgi:hypothetical protein